MTRQKNAGAEAPAFPLSALIADSCQLTALEREPSSEPQAPLAAVRGGDLSERVARGGAVGRVRIRPSHRVGDVVGVDAELRILGAAHGEALEQGAVEIPVTWTLGAA